MHCLSYMWEFWLDLQTPREKHMPGMHIFKTGNVFKVFWLMWLKCQGISKTTGKKLSPHQNLNCFASWSPRTQGREKRNKKMKSGEWSSPMWGSVLHLSFAAQSNQRQKCHKDSGESMGAALTNCMTLTECPSSYKEPVHPSLDSNLLFHGC